MPEDIYSVLGGTTTYCETTGTWAGTASAKGGVGGVGTVVQGMIVGTDLFIYNQS